MDIFFTDAQIWAIGTVLTMMVLDIVTGVVQAIVNQCLSSTKMREGILHKTQMLLVLAAVYVLEAASAHIAGLDLGGLGVVAVAIIMIFMEFTSIWENACKAVPELRESKLGKIIEASIDGDDAK